MVNKKLLVGALAVVLMAGGLLFIVTAASKRFRQDVATGGTSTPVYEHGNWRDMPVQEEFTLTERSGELFHSRDMEGHVWVVSFFFSACPANCWQQNQAINEIEREFGPQGVTFVSITCDPDNDTPGELRLYANKLEASPRWKFLTGDLLHIRKIGGEIFQTHVDRGVHNEHLIVMDKWGNKRGLFEWADPAQVSAMKEKLTELLAETEAPADQAFSQPQVPANIEPLTSN